MIIVTSTGLIVESDVKETIALLRLRGCSCCLISLKSRFFLCIRFSSTSCYTCCSLSLQSRFFLCIRFSSTCCYTFCSYFLKSNFFRCIRFSSTCCCNCCSYIWSRSSRCFPVSLPRIIWLIAVLHLRLVSLDTRERVLGGILYRCEVWWKL